MTHERKKPAASFPTAANSHNIAEMKSFSMPAVQAKALDIKPSPLNIARDLPPEAWHVVQQKQRRVKPAPVSDNGPIQLITKPGVLFPGKATMTSGEMMEYLKSGEMMQLKVKINRMSDEPWLTNTPEFVPIMIAADTVRKIYGNLFERCLENKNFTVSEIDALFDTHASAFTLVEDFVVDEIAKKAAYEKAAFKGSPADLGEMLSKTVSEVGEDKSPEDVMKVVVNKRPLTFKWIKPDIIATLDYQFFVKEDKDGSRTAGSAAILSLVEKYNLTRVTAPRKMPLAVGTGHVVIVEGLSLETVDDMEVSGWKEGIGKETLAEIGFVVLHSGVGDVNSTNARKLKDRDTYAIIDTGGSFAKGDEEAKTRQIKINYGEFLSSLDETNRQYLKTWEQLAGKLPASPAELLVT